MARANRREAIFHDDDDRRFFLATLSEACAMEEEIKTCWMPVVAEQVDAWCGHLRRVWYWGSRGFAETLRRISGKLIKENKRSPRANRNPPQVKAHGDEQAERWLAEGLQVAGLVAKDLLGLKRSDPRKRALAGLFWKRTTVSMEWKILGKGAWKAKLAFNDERGETFRFG